MLSLADFRNLRSLYDRFRHSRHLHEDRMTVEYKVRDRVLLLPDDHRLPEYQKNSPTYDMVFDPIYEAVGSHTPGRYFIDVGANVGDTAVVMRHNAANPILCVEGHPRFLEYLRHNTRGLADVKVTPTFIGVDEMAGAALQFESRGGTGAFASTPDKDAAPSTMTSSLRQILEDSDALRCGIALFKPDTDGLDAFILRDLLAIEELSPALFFECDLVQTLFEEHGESVWRQNFDTLEKRGYSLIIFDNFGYRMAGCLPGSYDLVWELNRYIAMQHANRFVHTYYLDIWAFPPEMAAIFEASRTHLRPDAAELIRRP